MVSESVGRSGESGGLGHSAANTDGMPRELASILLRKSLKRKRDDEPRCSDCLRTPLTGELMHVVEDDRVICSLCLANVPEERRGAVESRRVRATERPLAVVRQAA